jgi:hypothetical protein
MAERGGQVKGFKHLHQLEQSLVLYVSGQLDTNREAA